MARSQSRQRDKLLARAQAIRDSIAHDVVAPVSRQIAELQAALQVLSDAADLLSRQSVRAADGPKGPAAREAPVVFLHIPKTAGTTVTIWLRLLHGDQYSKATSYDADPERVKALGAALRERPGSVEVVAGHLPYSTRPLFPAASRFFTFLRDPIERSLSHFYYFRERASKDAQAIEGPAMPPDVPLAEAVAAWDEASPESRRLLPDNLQTRMLSGFDLDAPASRDMLEAARRNLRMLDVVGLTERFDESFALLHHVYGWKLLAIPSRRVRTHKRPGAGTLEPQVREGLRRLNALDEELYAEGARHFDATMARFGEAVLRDAAAVRLALDPGEAGSGAVPDVSRRAAEIAADTAAAVDADLLEQAHGLAMTLAPHVARLPAEVVGPLRQIAQVAERLTALVETQRARM